jgi:hypothetical protein
METGIAEATDEVTEEAKDSGHAAVDVKRMTFKAMRRW